ncbi:MAG: Ig-like domain-containing protein [Roseburia sp.]|nr:Ig-like domain-containing protein [Roseburia sp.]
MNKYFKHTKKLLFLVATMVMMLATTLVVLGAVPSSEAAAKYSPLTILKVGTHTFDSKKDQYKYDAFGNKTIGTAKPVIYTNGYTAAEDDWMGNQPQFEVDLNGTDGFEMVELDNFIKLEVSARVGYDTNADGKVDAYTNGLYNVKSSNESVATVIQGTEPNWDNEGNEYESQYIIITAGKKTGTATIKLTEANPENPKKPKTATVKVTVKKLVDDIGFDADVVKADENDELYTEVGVKGKVTLGTTPTVDASKKNIKYVLDATAKKYISVNAKGVITGTKSTADLEGGYVTVRVVAQDMQYNYYDSKWQVKKATWGINETIKVYVADPAVKSAKILNVAFAKDTTEANYKDGKAAQAYAAIPMVTNTSSDAHTFKLQVAAYSGAKWSGAEKVNAVRFTTSNAKVATVDKNGVITANANGSATITVVPADGVALSGKEALKVTVKVTTDVEKIETANTDVETFAGKVYTIKANVNAGVSNAKAKGLAYEISSAIPAGWTGSKDEADAFKAHVLAVSKEANVAKGKIRSDKEGKVVVRVYLKDAAVAAAYPGIEKNITINFVDPIKTITATVPVYQDIYKDPKNEIKFDHTPIKDAATTTLYVDRNSFDYTDNWEMVTETVNDTCVIKTTVAKQFTGAANLDDLLVPGKEKLSVTSSNENVVKVLGKVEGGFEVQAVGKGTAKVTVAATDGSKVKKVVTINVVQKVNEINVANAAGGEIYLAPDNKGVTKTTFKATTNADANNKGVTYTFIPNYKLMQGLGTIYGKLEKKTSSISLTKADNAILFPEGGNTEPVLLGTLKVTAKDALYFEKYVAPEVNHLAHSTEIKVYAVKQAAYVDKGLLDTIVSDMVKAVADGEEGITLYKGDKLDLAAALEIPAYITDRAITWSVGETNKDTDKNYISVANGVVTAKKATLPGDNVTVNLVMNTLDVAGNIVKVGTEVQVRVIPSQAEFNNELNTQITSVLKENDYTWLGAKPKFDAKKATLTLTISDITMGRDAANAEMKEQLINVVDVLKDATDVVKAVTATKYSSISVYDAVAGKTWTLQLADDKIVVFENGEKVGTYAALADAKADVASRITNDIDDIVEWANRKLVVTLNAYSTASVAGTDRAEQYNTKYYTTQYTVAVDVSDKDIEAFIDSKVENAVAAFAAKNAGKEASTGIESVKYDASKNATVVEIFDGGLAIESVLPIVKADAVASLEDIFANAVNAKVEIVDNENLRRFVEFNRHENSDVENLITKLYTELTKELGANATMKDLEGIRVYATVDFNYAGKVYAKSYEVTFKRTVVAVDAEVDERINAFINGLEANPYGTIEYSDVDNMAIVTVTDYDATLQDAARAVVGKVEGFVNTLTNDAYAESAKINNVTVGESEDGIGRITATDILQIIKPAWYTEGGVSARQLSELIGTTAVVEVTYDQGQVLYYIVKFQADYDQTNAKIAAAIDAQINEINWTELTDELIILEASREDSNTVVVAVNETKANEAIDKLNGTGLYTMIEAILTEAEANSGKTVTLTAGKKFVSVELATNTMTVSEMVAKLAIKNVGSLSKTPFNITIELVDGRTIDYVIEFVNANCNGGIKRNPVAVPMLEEGASSISFDATVKAGKVVYYSGNIGEMIMTVTGKDAYVVYRGKTYTAVDGVVTVAIGEANMWNPATPAIGNLGKKDATYKVEFAYPVGHSMNPEAISELSAFESYYEGTVEAGNSRGYSYAYKAVEDGTVTLWFAEVPADVEAYIEVNTTASYKVYTLDEDGVEDWKGDKFLTVPVKAEDILTIRVGAWPDVNFVYPEMPYSLAATFAYPEGHESNPVDLGTIEVPDYGTSVKVTVPAGETLWYQAKEIGGLVMTINNANGCTVSHDGATFEAVDGVVEFTLNMPMMYVRPVVFAITNGGETEATYTLELTYPLGSEQNPIMETPTRTATGYVLVLDVPAGEEVYYQAYNIGGMELTTATAEACTIIHAGNEFEAKDGVVELVLETPMPPYMPVSFGVRNNAEEDMTYRLVFAFPEGTQMNPIKISELYEDGFPSYYDGRVAEGGNGIYYTYTAEYTGNVLFSFAEHTANVNGEIVVQNTRSYKQLQLSVDAVNDIISMPVEEGDVLNISVGVLPAADWSYPAMGYSMSVAFEYPQGSAQNPVVLAVREIPGSINVTVPAGETVYYGAQGIGGYVMTINDAATCSVLHDGVTYEAEEGVVELTLNMPMMYIRPVVFAITNSGDAEMTYTLNFSIAEVTE